MDCEVDFYRFFMQLITPLYSYQIGPIIEMLPLVHKFYPLGGSLGELENAQFGDLAQR